MMTGVQRAKQFAPFSALKGMDEALLAMERVKVEKVVPASDEVERIDRIIRGLSVGDNVFVRAWDGDGYANFTGVFGGVDTVRCVIFVGGRAVDLDGVIAVRG